MEEKQTNEIVINLKDLWQVFVTRFWIIVLAALLAMGAMGIYKTATYQAKYESVATLYILPQDANSTAAFNVALAVINDCSEAITSYSVLDGVIEALDLKMSPAALKSMISTQNPDSSRFIYVSVKSNSPTMSKMIVDELCEICAEKMEVAMSGIRQINVFAQGKVSTAPCNKTKLTSYFIVGVLAAVATYAAFLVISLLKDRFSDEYDIEQTLGLTILGNIPNADEAPKSKGGKYGKYGRYGKYGKYGKYGSSDSRQNNNASTDAPKEA
ncbi:MAG: Wzz/FepE/Etk N-terminal domain-containing protein [Clostridia bacterium]|nr:Wzz/FepE/Etk N-terminal domain-containing protein [Clostridia bacterium]